MRDKNRIKPFMNEIAKLWEEECPDWRFSQLIENVFGSIYDEQIPFYVEDDEMLREFKKYFKKERKK